MRTSRPPVKPRPESEIREDLRLQLEAIVNAFERQLNVDIGEPELASKYFKDWPLP